MKTLTKVQTENAELNRIQDSWLAVLNPHLRAESFAPVPLSATAKGTPGQWAADASYLYICDQVNSWKRVSISSW